jgi:hypothetical protein
MSRWDCDTIEKGVWDVCRMIIDNLGPSNIGKVLPKFIRNFRDSNISSAKNNIYIYIYIYIGNMGMVLAFFSFATLTNSPLLVTFFLLFTRKLKKKFLIAWSSSNLNFFWSFIFFLCIFYPLIYLLLLLLSFFYFL